MSSERYERAFRRVCELTDYERVSGPARSRLVRNLDAIRALLERLGRPDRAFRSIHIAGTKGKGSTAAMIAEVLLAHGYRVGLYTSPHLYSITERIRVDNDSISEDSLASVWERILELVDDREPSLSPPTFFDLMTAAAFEHFRAESVGWAVVEVGLGGRLDSTNVIEADAGVITKLGLDHTEVLGSDLASIAREKIGIAKPGMSLVSERIDEPEAARVVAERCREVGAEIRYLDREIRLGAVDSEGRFDVEVDGVVHERLRIGVLGAHQRRNAALAVGILHDLDRRGAISLDVSAMGEALARIRIAARGEVLCTNPTVIVDGAHNEPSAAALRALLDESFGSRPRRFLIAISADKDWRRFVRTLLRADDRVVAVVNTNARGLAPSRLAEELRTWIRHARTGSSLSDELRVAIETAKEGEVVCVTGSLYLAAEIDPELRDGPNCAIGDASG